MRQFITYISTLALALHFTLGCCLHHAECQEMALALPAKENDCEALETDCHDHDHDGCSPASGQKHTPQGGCHSVPCAAVRVLKTQAPEVAQSFDQLAAIPATFFALSEANGSSDFLPVPRSPGEPPRLHLLHQVFLI